MRFFGLLVLVLLFAAQAQAQLPADLVIRPFTALHDQKVQASASPDIVSSCLIVCGADYLDFTTHFSCSASTPDEITLHPVTVTAGSGGVCVRGVVLTSAGVVSEPSLNKATILDVPLPPALLK
jgi:hypothetical protein